MVDYVVNPTALLSLRLNLRQRGKGSRVADLDVARQPELCRAIADLLLAPDGDRELEFDPIIAEQLVELGLLLSSTDVPRPVFFSCPLSADGLTLLPMSSAQEPPRGPLAVNPALRLQEGAEIPAPLRDRVDPCPALSPARPILWVGDARTQVWMPTWPDSELTRAILDLQAGRLSADRLGDDARRLLRLAGLLVDRDVASSAASWAEELERAAGDLRDRGHAVLRRLLSPLHQAAVRRYVRGLQREGAFHAGDDSVPTRTRVHNEAFTSHLHGAFSGLVNRIVPAPVRPSYSLLAHYNPGSVLRRHTDRPQCEWNVSWIADADPDVDEADAWPLHFEHDGRPGAARLEIGDAVVYSGRRTPHWREVLGDGHHVDACFFHFVDAHFEGSLD